MAKHYTVQSATLAPWFPSHLQRNIYLSLLHMEPEGGDEKAPKVPDSVLRAALLRRAVEDIRRIIQVRTAKQACSTLLQRGSVGDDLWQRFLRAEKEMEDELRDVVMEVRLRCPSAKYIVLISIPGERPCAKLGINDFPICE
jgi:translocation protein SEC66